MLERDPFVIDEVINSEGEAVSSDEEESEEKKE